MRSKIYLRAARHIAAGKAFYCCHALVDVGSTANQLEDFHDYFKPELRDARQPYFGGMGEKESRILALLFLNEITKEGNK